MSYVQRDGGAVWVVPPPNLTDDDVASVLAGLEAQLAGDTRYVLFFDFTHAGMPNAMQRQTIAAQMRRNTEKIRRRVRGIGLVLSSPVARGMVTAIFWITPPPVTYRIVATRPEAIAWADSLVEATTRP
jgi:hypothetical protein